MAPCDYATPPAENLRLVAWLRACSDEDLRALIDAVYNPPRSTELAAEVEMRTQAFFAREAPDACTGCGKVGLALDHGRCGRCGYAGEGRQ